MFEMQQNSENAPGVKIYPYWYCLADQMTKPANTEVLKK